MATDRHIKEFILGYKVCALWASNDDSDEEYGCPLDENYGFCDIDEDDILSIEKDCREFIKENESLLDQVGDYEQHGHDYWLTRNHHGAGFWDRGYGEIGNTLTENARKKGEVYLYVGVDGMLHIQ